MCMTIAMVMAPASARGAGVDDGAQVEGPAALIPAQRARLSDAQLILLARRLIQAGRPAPACETLADFFARTERNTELDWEAAILQEGCRSLGRGGVPIALPSPGHVPGPVAGQPPPRLNAVQVFLFSSPRPDRLGEELRSLKARGVDTIIVRAFHNLGDRPLFRELPATDPGFYFRTGEAPVTADVMGAVVENAHAQGLRVFGWLSTRRSDALIAGHPEWLEYQYDPDLGRSIPSRSLSLFQPGARRALRNLACDLAATGVDGILFQDDLIMRWNEGFSDLAGQAFLAATGRGIHPDDLFVLPSSPGKAPRFRPLFRVWCAWKSRVILEVLGELTAEARRVNPALLTAANVYYESLLQPENGLAWYAQDVPGMAGTVDFLALMSYHRQMKSELSLDDARLRELLSETVRRARSLAIAEARIIFKVQTIDWESRLPIPEAEWTAVRGFFEEAGRFSLAVLQN